MLLMQVILPSIPMLQRETHLASQRERLEDVVMMDMQHLVDLCSRILEHHLRYSIIWYICISLVLFFVYVNKRVCMLKIYGSLKNIPYWDHTYPKKGWDWENLLVSSISLLINSMAHFTFLFSDSHFRARVNSSYKDLLHWKMLNPTMVCLYLTLWLSLWLTTRDQAGP